MSSLLRSNIGTISCGGTRVVMISEKGNLMWYSTSNRAYTISPVIFESTNVKFATVSAGYSHTAAIDTQGKVWTWGENRPFFWGNFDPDETVDSDDDEIYYLTYDDEFKLGRTAAHQQEPGRNIQRGQNIQNTPTRLDDEVFIQSQDGFVNTSVRNTMQPEASLAVMVACGQNHTMVLLADGTVWTFGLGSEGQLGHANDENVHMPRRIKADSFNYKKIVMVAAGGYHSMALSSTGDIFTWGCGAYGKLGHGDEINKNTPSMIKSDCFNMTKVTLIAGGGVHSAAVTENGSLFVWGHGQFLGLDDNTDRHEPTQMPKKAVETGVVMVTCGYRHILVVTDDNNLWTMDETENIPLKLQPEKIGNLEISTIAAGDNLSVVVTRDGALYTWRPVDLNPEPNPTRLTLSRRITKNECHLLDLKMYRSGIEKSLRSSILRDVFNSSVMFLRVIVQQPESIKKNLKNRIFLAALSALDKEESWKKQVFEDPDLVQKIFEMNLPEPNTAVYNAKLTFDHLHKN
jgi:alpha-tubulin suppressor-like RCC1 family protein